ncbi:MAG: glycosyltransferase family 4 protein [Gemmatimonadaceae bacterium]
MALCIPQELSSADEVNVLLAVQMIVAAPDESSARLLTKMLDAQRWNSVRVVFPVADAVQQARESGAHAVFIVPGTTLAPTALESAWWALETRADIGFVAFGDERGAKTPLLDAIATCAVVRSELLTDRAVTSDIRWPGIAPVFALFEHSKRGHLIRDPLVSRVSATTGPDAPVARALAEIRAKGLTDAVLGDTGGDAIPREPQQLLDERPLPLRDTACIAPKALGAGKHRVLALLQGFPMGGYAAFNADFLPRLVKRGHALTVCTTEVWRTDWRLDGVRAVTSDITHAAGVVTLMSMPRYVSYLIESRDIDVVLVSHSLVGYRMLPWLRRQHPNVAFVDYVHTDWFEAQMYGSYAAIGAAHADWLDAQMASSRTLANDLVQRGARPETTLAQPINLDVTDWDPSRFPANEIRASLGCKPNQPLILFAGRLSPEKRPLLAVECWRALVASGVDAKFAFAGNGPLLNATLESVEKAGLKDRVEFLGELDGDMLRYVYSAADVYHAPSEIEGIARALFEAMAMQCVPVVANVGGQHELVSNDCGWLVAHGPNEVERYVAALTAAVNGKTMRPMQKAARARIAQHFTSAQCVAGFERAFSVAIEQRIASQSAASQNAGVPAESRSASRELAISGLETMRRHFWRAYGK